MNFKTKHKMKETRYQEVHPIWFYLHEIQEQAKLFYTGRKLQVWLKVGELIANSYKEVSGVMKMFSVLTGVYVTWVYALTDPCT